MQPQREAGPLGQRGPSCLPCSIAFVYTLFFLQFLLNKVLLKQCKAIVGKKGERLPHDSGVWSHTFFVRYHTIFVWYHTVKSCGSLDRVLPGIRVELQRDEALSSGKQSADAPDGLE